WVAYTFRPRPSGDPAVFKLTVYPPSGTTFPFEVGGPWPAVSPDGRQLAFVALRSDGEQELWFRALDSTTARPLQGTSGAARPFWSPDSRSIGFFPTENCGASSFPPDVRQSSATCRIWVE